MAKEIVLAGQVFDDPDPYFNISLFAKKWRRCAVWQKCNLSRSDVANREQLVMRDTENVREAQEVMIQALNLRCAGVAQLNRW